MLVSETLRRAAVAPPDSPVGSKAYGRIAQCIEGGFDEASPVWEEIRLERARLARADEEQREFARQELHPVEKPTRVAAPLLRFSPAQERVLVELAVGCSNEEISERVGLSTKTVKNHIYAMFQAVGVDNRVRLARWAWDRDLKLRGN